MKVTVSRKAHFNAAHRLYRKDWTDEIDTETGYVIDIKILKDIIKEEIEDAFDHKNLNLEVEEFKTLNPTAENIVVVIYDKIKSKLKTSNHLEVTLYETPRNFVTYSGN
ncbi:MAG: 6-carboxytetrahydropterin synthase [Aquaticitalea sp.]